MSVDCNLRLSDVHATADTVGREFKKLTDRFGMECAMGLLQPIVHALEWLEAYVESYQHLQTQLSELQMENDTVIHEKKQREFLAEENKRLSEMIRELQRQNKCLLMEMDEFHFKTSDHSNSHHQLIQHSGLESEHSKELEPTTTPDQSLIPQPHVPDRVVHISQNYPSRTNSHSPTLTPSPPPPSTTTDVPLIQPSSTSRSTSTNIQSPLNHIPKNKSLSSPPPTLHTSPPLLPSHHHLYAASRMVQTPPVTRAHRLLQPVGRSSSLSDVAGNKVQPLVYPTSDRQEEDMYEKSRVTRRLSQVEGDLDKTTQQLRELQHSREKITEENKQLKTQLQQLKAEAALQNICTSKETGKKTTKEAPRYYKEDVMRVLTERNELKEKLHTLEEELAEAKDALKIANRPTTLNRVTATTTNGVVTSANKAVSEELAVVSVRSILTESIDLNTYYVLTQTNVQSHTSPVYNRN